MTLPLAGEDITANAIRLALAGLLTSAASASASVATLQSTVSTSYGDLGTVGPSVTLTSVGTRALVLWRAGLFNSTATNGAGCTVAITGATTLAAADVNGLLGGDEAGTGFGQEGMQFMLATITPGSNTFTMKYRCTGTTASFQRRSLLVIAP